MSDIAIYRQPTGDEVVISRSYLQKALRFDIPAGKEVQIGRP